MSRIQRTIVSAYKRGDTLESIAAAYGVSRNHAKALILAAGERVRSPRWFKERKGAV